MLFSKLTTFILYTICFFMVLLPISSVYPTNPSPKYSLVLSDSLEVNESAKIKDIKNSFNSHAISGSKVLDDLTNLNYSLNFKYLLINELIHSQLDKHETLFILDGFINHIQNYEYRLKKSLPSYSYHIFTTNISKIFLYMAEICDGQGYEQYLIQSVSYNPDEHNTSVLADYYFNHQRYSEALSLFIKSMQIEDSIIIRERAEKCYGELYDSSISFDQYLETLNKQKVHLFIETIELPKRIDRLKVLNDYGFGKRFFADEGLLLITYNDRNSKYLINSFHELSQRSGFNFHAIVISRTDRTLDYPDDNYISIFPEQYHSDIWNDFKLDEIPTLIFLAKKQKELLRIGSHNRELPEIVEEILKKDILTEF